MGLVLALTLVKNGVKVRIIEKEAGTHKGQRGTGIMVTLPRPPFMRRRAI